MTTQLEPRWQMMPPLSDKDYQRLKESIAKHGILPGHEPEIDEQGRIIDGHHRALICAELGKECPTRPAPHFATDEEAWDYAFAVNVHRRHLSIEQKRDLIAEWLRRHPGESNRGVASLVGTSDHTVARVRADLEEQGTIPVAPPDNGAVRSAQNAHSVQPQYQEPEEERTENVADHRGLCWVEVVIGYPNPSSEERERRGLPYRTESARLRWQTDPVRVTLTTSAPKSVIEAGQFIEEIARLLARQMRQRPLRTMLSD